MQWVQCAYSPPYEFAAYDPSEDEEEEARTRKRTTGSSGDTEPDVAAKPTEDQLEMQAKLKEAGLAGAWSCATEPPKLW